MSKFIKIVTLQSLLVVVVFIPILGYAKVQEIILSPILVDATNPDGLQQDSGTSNVQLDRTQLAKKVSRHTAELLQEIAGVDTPGSPLSPELSVRIRGIQDFGRVNMSIENMRQNFQVSGHGADGSMYLDSELLSSLSVDKGPSSNLGGSGVSGGMVNFKLLDFDDLLTDPDKNFAGFARAFTGVPPNSNGQRFTGSAGAAWRINPRASIMAVASYKNLGDYNTGNQGVTFQQLNIQKPSREIGLDDRIIPRIKTKNNQQNMASLLLRGKYQLTDYQDIKLTYQLTKTLFSAPSEFSYSEYFEKQGEVLKQFRPPYYDKVSASNLALDYAFMPDSNWLDLSAKLYYTNTELVRKSPKTSNIELAQHQQNAAIKLTGAELANFIKSCKNGDYSQASKYFIKYNLRCFDHYATFNTKTIGFNLVNKSTIALFNDKELIVNTGLEFAFDRVAPKENERLAGSIASTDATPPGKRLLGGVFTNANYQHNDWLRLTAGLRYDYFLLTGKAVLDTSAGGIFEDTSGRFTYGRHERNIDRAGGKLSPTFGLFITPVKQLEAYYKFGQS